MNTRSCIFEAMKYLIFFILTIGLVACFSENQQVKQDKQERKPLTQEALNQQRNEMKMDTIGWEKLHYGVKRKEIKKGYGQKVMMGDKITANYKGFFKNGSLFDQSSSRPFVFELGMGVIPGWNVALNEVAVGSVIQFYIPAEMGYGEKGMGVIPPNMDIMFEVEILEVLNKN